MSINKKLNLAFTTLIVIVFLCLGLLLQQFYRIRDKMEETVDSRVVQVQTVKNTMCTREARNVRPCILP